MGWSRGSHVERRASSNVGSYQSRLTVTLRPRSVTLTGKRIVAIRGKAKSSDEILGPVLEANANCCYCFSLQQWLSGKRFGFH